MIEEFAIEKGGFVPTVVSKGWRICSVTEHEQYGDLKCFKKHNTTDEAFVLLKGKAELYTVDNDKIQKIEMETEYIYNIPKSTWHHLKVYNGAVLIAIENDIVLPQDTERMEIYDDSTRY